MSENLGIEDIKIVFQFGASLGHQLSEDLKDNKMSLSEIMGLIPTILQLPDILSRKQAIIDQAKNLTIEEVKELAELVEEEISNEDVTATIEDALNIAVSVRNVINRFSKKKETTTGVIANPDGTQG